MLRVPRDHQTFPSRFGELVEARRLLDEPVVALSPEWLRQVRDAFAIRDRAALQAIRFGWSSAVQACEVLEGGVGVIEIRGALLQGSWCKDYTDIRAAVDDLAANPAVHSIMLDIDSPGGDVHAEQFALADRIREVRAVKPVWAIANEQATSAAYVIAAQASKIFAANGNTAILGSLGVIATHTDWSKYDERIGITTTEVVTGRHKNELSQNRPLSKDGRATLERLVEGAFVEVIDAISAGRKGLTDEKIRAQEAAIYLGGEAQEQGLVDGIALREELVERLVKKAQGSGVFVPAATATSGTRTEPAATEEASMADPTKTMPADPAQPGAQPAAAALGGAQVVDINAARDGGINAERSRVTEIQDLCRLAGSPERAAGWIENGTSVAEVRRALLEARASAAGDEIDGHAPAVAAGGRKIDTSAIYAKWNAMMNPGRAQRATSARVEV